MQHNVTRKSFSFRAKYITIMFLLLALTTDLISTPRPPPPQATILPFNYTNLLAAAYAAGHVAPARAMYAPSRPHSPLADRHAPYADESRSPCPIPSADTTNPPTSSPLPNAHVDGCPPPTPSLYPSLAPFAMPLRLYILMIAHLTRMYHETLALTCAYLIVDPSALLLPSPSLLTMLCPTYPLLR
jgi:hypothetical protein